MAHDADIIQREFIRNKGKSQSVIDLSNEIESLNRKIEYLTNKIKALEDAKN